MRPPRGTPACFLLCLSLVLSTSVSSSKADEPGVRASDVIPGGIATDVPVPQLERLEKMIANTEASSEKLPGLMFQLATLYRQKQRYWNLQVSELDATSITALDRRQRMKTQRRYQRKEHSAFTAALKLYTQLAEPGGEEHGCACVLLQGHQQHRG